MKRKLSAAAITVIIVAIFGALLWETIKLALNTPNPICVIRSHSMTPAFRQGDIIFVTNFTAETIRVGDVIVFRLPNVPQPIAHRVLMIRHSKKAMEMLTKGDNNWSDDVLLYQKNGLNSWLRREHLIGRVRLTIPLLGKIKGLFSGQAHSPEEVVLNNMDRRVRAYDT